MELGASQAESHRPNLEIKGDYGAYKASEGTLSLEAYHNILSRAAEAPAKSKRSEYVQAMAKAAGITASPEVVAIYDVLRDEKVYPEKNPYAGQSDQKLLAEALRIAGDTSALDTLIANRQNIFN